MKSSLLNHKRTAKGMMLILAITVCLLTLLPAAPTAGANGYSTPTPPPVGGEYVVVNILQVLAPYLIIAFFGAAVVVSLVLYSRRKR